MKKKTLIIFFVAFFGLSLAIYQYAREMQTELISAAYSTAKPANGHSWTEMECTSSLCLSGENVGMGTSTPGYKLDVQGGQINTSGGLCIAGDCKTNWSSIGGAWTVSSNNIYSSNSGNVGVGTASPSQKLEVGGSILASGDVCNGSGKCLSSTYQTNVIVGTNPTCPTNQTMIMKAYSGVWYTADNATITSWNKVTCGQQLSADGTAFLVNGAHTTSSCTSAGGVAVPSDVVGLNQCKFDFSVCPAGWTQYKNYSSTNSANYCYVEGNNGGAYLSYHSFSDLSTLESISVWKCKDYDNSFSGSCNNRDTCTIDCSGGTYGGKSCTNVRVQVGCY